MNNYPMSPGCRFALFLKIFLAALLLLKWMIVSAQGAPQYPVIFVHGINDSALSFMTMIDHLDTTEDNTGVRLLAWKDSSGPLSCSWKTLTNSEPSNWTPIGPGDVSRWHAKIYFAIDFSDNTDLRFSQQAVELKRVIDCVVAITGKPQVILVAHSMGGIAARFYLQNLTQDRTTWQDDVVKLITIGTPHNGSPLANLTGLFRLVVNDIASTIYRNCSGTPAKLPQLRHRRVALERHDQGLVGIEGLLV
ncbi:alpha/beta fold hydrolase [uncultured Thiodictyon sp.]|uniref:esterase/lipase family protein n=1 Tax=uncultured Thiodictyon sp. TaxID=1846217 RepID=UPI0025EF0DC5|nr:alpha/beta fold hydrolase [uncultured Thiodictyon sp.]